MVRSGYARRNLTAIGLTTAGLIACTMQLAPAADDAFRAPTTLAPQVASENAALDATIASLVRRGLLPDIRPAHTASQTKQDAVDGAPPQRIAAMPSDEATAGKWRPAGTRRLEAEQARRAAEKAFAQPQQTPSSPSIGENSGEHPMPAHDSAAAPQTPDSSTSSDSPLDAINGAIKLKGPTLVPYAEAENKNDELAPIDELSETPAPADDAPGDPVEPEFTGAAIADALLPPAKPLSEAPKSTVGGNVALGEPDRLARPSDRLDNPNLPDDSQEAEEAPSSPRATLPSLTRNQKLLRDKVRSVLKHYYNRPLNTRDRSPWEVMHAMLAYEVHSRVLQGGPEGQPITAVGWLCFNQPCKDRTLMYLNEDGDLRVKVGPALQGHHGQLLALLAQARVRSDYPLKVDGQDFTVADLIEMEKLTCYPKTELTFKLIGLQRYLDIEDTWVNDQGMQWDFPKLLVEEMAQPVRTAACGGTHRLAGLALTVKKRRASGLPIDGQYAAAEKFVANYQNYAYRLQNSDGSFSTEWFKGPGSNPDIDRRLKTTGHQLELLLYAGSEEQLHYYRTVRAVNYLANIMHANRNRDWEAGPLGHAIHALVLYDRLAFAPYDRQETAPGPVAERPGRSQR